VDPRRLELSQALRRPTRFALNWDGRAMDQAHASSIAYFSAV